MDSLYHILQHVNNNKMVHFISLQQSFATQVCIYNVTQWTGKGLVDIVRLAENRHVSTIRIRRRLRSFTGHGTIAMHIRMHILHEKLVDVNNEENSKIVR